MQGLATSMTEFDSAQLLTLAQPGPEGLQAEGGDVLVIGAVWLTEKLCEIYASLTCSFGRAEVVGMQFLT